MKLAAIRLGRDWDAGGFLGRSDEQKASNGNLIKIGDIRWNAGRNPLLQV